MKRGLAPPFVNSAFPMTRRSADQLLRVRYREVGEHPRRLAGPLRLARGGFHLRRDLRAVSRSLPAIPSTYCTPFSSHQAHQVVAAEAAVGADHDRGPRPMLADVADDAGDLLRRAVGGIIGRRSKLRRQQMPAAEDVQRQIAVAIVVAVEVPTFLLAVERIVGGIEVDDNAHRRLAMSFQEQIDEQPLDGRAIVIELVVTVPADLRGMLQPVERRLAGERPARLVDDGGERRIEAQNVVVDEVLVAEREAEDALAQQIGQRVLDGLCHAVVGEAGRQPLGQSQLAVGTGEQRHAAIRRDRAAVEGAHKLAGAGPSQIEFGLHTLCRHRGSSPLRSSRSRKSNFL